MIFRDYLQVLTSILHNWLYRLAKPKTRKKAWNGRSKPWKFSIYADIRCGVHVWRPLLYQLSYTPKYLVAARWGALTRRKYDTTYMRFCQAIFARNPQNITRRKIRSMRGKSQLTCGRLALFELAGVKQTPIIFLLPLFKTKKACADTHLHSLDHWLTAFASKRF